MQLTIYVPTCLQLVIQTPVNPGVAEKCKSNVYVKSLINDTFANDAFTSNYCSTVPLDQCVNLIIILLTM